MSVLSNLDELEDKLDNYRRFESYLGKDFERPIQSLKDGYPEMTISLVGIILESVLKFIWEKEGISGDPSRRTLHDLLQACNDYIDSRRAYDYMIDLQRLRNRAVHDVSGDSVDEADAIDALRKLIEIFKWFKVHVGEHTDDDGDEKLDSEVSKLSRFVSGFSRNIGYELKDRSVFSHNTVYKLFEKSQGIRYSYLELIISNSKDDLDRIIARNKSPFLDTSYPKHSRYVVTGFEDTEQVVNQIPESNLKAGGLDAFIDDFFDYETYASDVLSQDAISGRDPFLDISGKVLEYTPSVQDFTVSEVNETNTVRNTVLDSARGNFLVLGAPGGGKTHFCRRLVQDFITGRSDDYVFYFDLSNVRKRENIEDYITRTLEEYIKVPKSYIIDLYDYVCQEGYIMTVFDGFDHLCQNSKIDTVLSKFSEIAKFFSEDSRIVLSSRTSFFADTKHMRELLHRDAIVSDRVSDGLTSVGIDPLQLPNFTALKLDLVTATQSEAPAKINRILRKADINRASFTPLIYSLSSSLSTQEVYECIDTSGDPSLSSAKVIYRYALSIGLGSMSEGDLHSFLRFFYEKFSDKENVFSLSEVYSYLGEPLFVEDIISHDSLRVKEIFEPVERDKIKFSNSVFGEFFFALYYVSHRSEVNSPLYINDKVRSFIYQISEDPEFFEVDLRFEPDDLSVRPGPFVVGEADTLHIRRLESGIRIDPHPVTVSQYNEFREAADSDSVAGFEHPEQPEDWSHEPFFDKLKVDDYFSNPRFTDHPAVCIGWWSAYACAQYFGKRLPTSLEWECAARGPFGRLFSWGDHFDLSRANCADYWGGEALINYEEWKEHFYSDERRGGETTAVQKFEKNVSPYNAYNMCGNVWEWTASTSRSVDRVVICGGSYDNPFKAVQASSKGIYRTEGRSNVVGFRMCESF